MTPKGIINMNMTWTLLLLPNPCFKIIPSPLSHTCAAPGQCDAQTTGLLSWPDTEAGTTQTLPCPNTNAMISRTCSRFGVWDSVDPSLCTSFTSINTVSFDTHVWSGLVSPIELLCLVATSFYFHKRPFERFTAMHACYKSFEAVNTCMV